MVRNTVQSRVPLLAMSTSQVGQVCLNEFRFWEAVEGDFEAELIVFLVHVRPEDVRVVV